MFKRSMIMLLALFVLAGLFPVYASASTTNIALNKPVTASSNWSTTTESNAVDGMSWTEWGPADVSEIPWLKVDLGSVKEFSSYAVESWTDRYNDAIRLEISNDDITWTEVDTVSGNTDIRIFRTLPQPVSARYVKITITEWSFFPDITEFQLYTDLPSEPTGVSATTGDGQVTLDWSSISDETSYEVYQGTTPGVYNETPVANVNGTTATVEGLTNGTAYYFAVRSINNYGSSDFSNEVIAIPQMAAPDAPAGLTATAADGQVTLSWSGVTGAVNYDLFMRTAEDEYESNPVATVSGETLSYTLTGLTNGATYNFLVKATNPGGSSDSSNEVSITPQVPVPGVPVLLSATGSDSKVGLTWDAINGSTGYKIYKSTTSGVYGVEEATVSGSTYEYDVTELENGTPYYFVVKATNSRGDSAASNEVNAIPTTTPAPPTNVSAAAGNGKATISFDKPSVHGGSPITHYEVIATPGNTTTIGTASPITVGGLTNGISYTFTVRAVNGVGSGLASVASNVVTPFSASSGNDISTPMPEPTANPVPTANPAPASANHVFNSSIVDEIRLVSDMQSKVAEVNKAGVKNKTPDSKGHWAEKAIDTFVKLNFIHGYEDGEIKPNGQITRAEFAMFISRVFNMSAMAGHSIDMNDISSHWAKEAIEELVGAGVFKGYGDGTFRPNQAISREEIVVLISRIMNMNDVNKDESLGDFSDLSKASPYATHAIKDAAQAGIINGMNEGTFNPHGHTTRAEAITIILNILRLNPQIKELLNSMD